jgi:hypothetical protein
MEVADGVGVTDRLTDGLADGLADGVDEVLTLGVTDGLDEAPAEASDDEAPGESFGSLTEGVDPEQPATDAEASMVTVAQVAAVSLTPNAVLNPARVAVRILIGPPRKPGGWLTRFPVPASQSASEGKSHSPPG